MEVAKRISEVLAELYFDSKDSFHLIGEGAFNNVYILHDTRALKTLKKHGIQTDIVFRISKNGLNETKQKMFLRESQMAKLMGSKNVSPIVFDDALVRNNSNDKVYGVQVMEKMSGTISSLLENENLHENELYNIIHQCIDILFKVIDYGTYCVDINMSNFLYMRKNGKITVYMTDYDVEFCGKDTQELISKNMYNFKSFSAILFLTNALSTENRVQLLLGRLQEEFNLDLCSSVLKIRKYLTGKDLYNLVVNQDNDVPKDIQRLLWYMINNDKETIDEIIQSINKICSMMQYTLRK